jgi:peptide-methionine (S)-S-oxide reductase
MNLIVLLIAFFSLSACAEQKNQRTVELDDLKQINYMSYTDTVTFGTGCFWCTEAVFEQLEGVIKVTSGYSGGQITNPTYEEVCTGATGHAECCQIVYDPQQIKFDDLLKVFWQVHDPTTLNKQGNDVGTQYRSVVFYHDEVQKQITESYIAALNKSGAYDQPIVTTLEPYTVFFPAEEYHQTYYKNNSSAPYCRLVIRPKLEKFEKVFAEKLKNKKTD